MECVKNEWMKYRKKRQKTNDKYLKMGYWYCLFVFFLSEDRVKIYVMIVKCRSSLWNDCNRMRKNSMISFMEIKDKRQM